MHVAALAVNGLWPSDAPRLPVPKDAGDGLATAFAAHVERIGDIGRTQAEEVEAWSHSDAARGCGAQAWMTLPWRWRGLANLEAMQGLLVALGEPGGQAS
jgi:hypothetical protein